MTLTYLNLLKRQLWAMLCFLFLVSGSSLVKAENKIKIVASIRPIALIAGDLLGDLAEVSVLLPSNADPHHYTLRVSDRRNLAQADLVLWLGPEFELFLVKALADRLEIPLGTAGGNAHDWLDPIRARAMADAIAQTVSAMRPDLTQKVMENLTALSEQYAVQHRQSLAALSRHKQRGFIGDHNAYQALAGALQLQQIGVLQTQEDIAPSAQHLAQLTKIVQQEKPRCLLASEVSNTSTERWSQRFALPLVTVDIVAAKSTIQSYPALFEDIAGAIDRCLGG